MEEKIEFAQIQDWTPFVVWFGNYEQPVVKGQRSPTTTFSMACFVIRDCNASFKNLFLRGLAYPLIIRGHLVNGGLILKGRL